MYSSFCIILVILVGVLGKRENKPPVDFVFTAVVPRQLWTQENLPIFVNLEEVKSPVKFIIKLSGNYSKFYASKSTEFTLTEPEVHWINFDVKDQTYFKRKHNALKDKLELSIEIVAFVEEQGQDPDIKKETVKLEILPRFLPAKFLFETEKEEYSPGADINYRVVITDENSRLVKGNYSKTVELTKSWKLITPNSRLKVPIDNGTFAGTVKMLPKTTSMQVNVFGSGRHIRSELKSLKEIKAELEEQNDRDDSLQLELKLTIPDLPADNPTTNLTLFLFRSSRKRIPVAGTCNFNFYLTSDSSCVTSRKREIIVRNNITLGQVTGSSQVELDIPDVPYLRRDPNLWSIKYLGAYGNLCAITTC